MDVIKHLVGAEMALAVLPKGVVAPEIEDGRLALIPVRGWPIRRSLSAVRHARKYVSRTMLSFFEAVREETGKV
jgi:DNA-binding transcriptional LysR family regulator